MDIHSHESGELVFVRVQDVSYKPDPRVVDEYVKSVQLCEASDDRHSICYVHLHGLRTIQSTCKSRGGIYIDVRNDYLRTRRT